MSVTATSPLFARQGDDGLRVIPPFLQPNAMEPVIPDGSGDDRQHVSRTDQIEESSPNISTPIICVITVVAILATAMLFWSIKRCRSAHQKHEEEGSNNFEKGSTGLNEKLMIGWKKIQGKRKRQSTWFDVTTGQHFAEVLPSSSTICYVSNLSTEHLHTEGRQILSTHLSSASLGARDASRPFSDTSSGCPLSGHRGLPLQVGGIRYASQEEILPPIDYSPVSVYSQSSYTQGLCKPISPLKLKPRVLHNEHPMSIPPQSNETGDPFRSGASAITAVRISKVQADSHIDSNQIPMNQGGKMQADRTRAVDPTPSCHFPSSSVTARIIRNSIYHHQSPPSKSRSKPPRTADSDSPAFEYDDSSPQAIRRHGVSGEEKDASNAAIVGICHQLAATYAPPAGLEIAALSSRRDAPRIRRRTSHNVLSTREPAATWSSDGKAPEAPHHMLDPGAQLPLISMQDTYDMAAD